MKHILHLAAWLGGALLLLGMPLLGVWINGAPIAPYLEFPPRTILTPPPAFSWPLFIALAVLITLLITPFLGRLLQTRRSPLDSLEPRTMGSGSRPHLDSIFPWWGWLALIAGLTFWILAWSRFSWFKPFQAYTFTPLWLAYIVFMNALAFRRSGHSPLTHQTGMFLTLFPLSALFWWFFEYLNRFVQNWHYLIIGDPTAGEYILRATLPFSTVLPAFVATRAWLISYPRFSAGLDQWHPVNLRHPDRLAWIALILAAASLVGISLHPELLFPFLWISPLIIVASIRTLQSTPTLLSAARRGNWQPIFLAAVSALICGFFWELWNFYSQDKWIYTVPYVQRFHLFEMPLLGFAGYLPFGLECALIADRLTKEKEVSV